METENKQAPAKRTRRKKTAVDVTRKVGAGGRPKARAADRSKTVTAADKSAQDSNEQLSKVASGIMRTLHSEHKYITVLQNSLEKQTKQLEPGGKPDYRILSDMLDYIANYPDEFHHPLEDVIFKRLVERHHASIGTVEELLSQHQDMARDTQFLLKQINAICAGKQKPMRNQLRQDLQNYVAFYRAHINLEEGEVFPAAKKYLQESDWQTINNSLHVVEDPVFSEKNTSKYKNLASYISDKSEEAIADIAQAQLFSVEALIESVQAGRDGFGEIQEVCKRHVRNQYKTNAETLHDSREEKSAALLSLPKRVINHSLEGSGETLREIGKVLSSTWGGVIEPFAVRINYFKTTREDKNKGE